MCNINNLAEIITPKHKVEAMLHDIAYVLRLTRQLKAEIQRERAEADVEPQRRTAKPEEVVAVSM